MTGGAPEGRPGADRRRARVAAPTPWRWPVDLAATVQEHRSCAFDIRVLDISVSGCRIWAGFRLKPGGRAKLTIEGFAPFEATVVWSENWFAALRFAHPLHLSVLRHLVMQYPVTEETDFNAVRDRRGSA